MPCLHTAVSTRTRNRKSSTDKSSSAAGMLFWQCAFRSESLLSQCMWFRFIFMLWTSSFIRFIWLNPVESYCMHFVVTLQIQSKKLVLSRKLWKIISQQTRTRKKPEEGSQESQIDYPKKSTAKRQAITNHHPGKRLLVQVKLSQKIADPVRKNLDAALQPHQGSVVQFLPLVTGAVQIWTITGTRTMTTWRY